MRYSGNHTNQHGAFLVIMILMLAVLLGFAALAIDVGRLLVLRTQMQHAADAAALAAAAELDQSPGSVARAMRAARTAINDESHFARQRELLGETGLPDAAFRFFCVIGSAYDISPSNSGFADVCSGPVDAGDAQKYLAAEALLDREAHYVEVTLDEALADSGQFTVDLIFLPLLRLLNIDAADMVSLTARAVAGRSFYVCNYPPLAICDPFESAGEYFRDRMPLGGHIELKQQGSNQWSSGNFGFLQTIDGQPGADAVANALADEQVNACTPPVVTTQTGGMTQKMQSAINTRFDEYDPPAPFNNASAPTLWPPAPSVTEYALDATTLADARFGTGDWPYNDWADALVARYGIDPRGSLGSMASRWQAYNWEISQGLILQEPVHTAGSVDRRRLFVAVVSCQAAGLDGGKSTAVVAGNDGFAKIFLIKKADGPPNATIYGEYIGWGDQDDSEYHVDVQLYE
ncbi:MAG TPA: pilus assembly protein TadG-related protein [Pseudomonadales bacterium]